jgi:regulator of protease activity HflC (stomatin/prohibitin superfamily)
VQVAAAYESVAGALQTRQAKLLDAEAHQVRTNALAVAEALRRKRVAEGDRHREEANAKARAISFTNQMRAYAAAPSVYPMRRYLDTLTSAGSDTRKIIMTTTNTDDIFMLNLEEKFSSGLLGAPLPATSK